MFGKKRSTPQTLSPAERYTLQGFQALDAGDVQKALSSFRAGLEFAPLDRTLREGLHEALAYKSQEELRTKSPKNKGSQRLNVPVEPIESKPTARTKTREQSPKNTPATTPSRKKINPGFASSDGEDEAPSRSTKSSGSKWKMPFAEQVDFSGVDDDQGELDAALGTFAEEFKPMRDRRTYSTRRNQVSLFARVFPWVLGIIVAGGILTFATFAKESIQSFLEEAALPKIPSAEQYGALPDKLNALLLQASEDLTQRKSDRAVSELKKAWEEFPQFQESIQPALVSSLRVHGTKLFNDAQYEDALSLFEQTTNLEPEDENNWIELGRSLREYGRRIQGADEVRSQALFGRAKVAYERALDEDSKNTSALIGLGQVFFLLKEREQAISQYQRVVALSPGSPEARLAKQYLDEITGSNS